MSRSFKKTPISGNTTATSEKRDKRRANRLLRRVVKILLEKDPEEDEQNFPIMDEVADVWSFGKDGKSWRGGVKDPIRLFKCIRK